jgi:hypothetical protein
MWAVTMAIESRFFEFGAAQNLVFYLRSGVLRLAVELAWG